MTDWSDELRPRNKSEWVCSSQVRNQVERVFFASWYHGHPLFKALLVHGQQGCGKSSLVYAFAGPLDWNIVKYNMSLVQSSDIRDIVHFTQRPTDARGRNNLALFDEVDGFKDGEALKSVVENTRIPIVMTANWPRDLRIENVLVVEVKPPSVKLKMELLRWACKEKGVEVDDYKLETIAETCKTLRGCIIALQRCVEYGSWKGVLRPSEDYSPEEELLQMLKGEVGETTNWGLQEIPKYLRYAAVNGVKPQDLSDLRQILAMSHEESLEELPTEFMLMLRSDATSIRRPKWRVGTPKRLKERKTRAPKGEEKRDAVEFKSVGNSKVVMKKRVVESVTAQSLW